MKQDGTRKVPTLITLAIALCAAGSLAGCATRQVASVGIADADITSGVEARLSENARLAPYTIAVETTDGVVHLSGDVATGADRDSAERIAAASKGVVRVDNYILFGRVPASGLAN